MKLKTATGSPGPRPVSITDLREDVQEVVRLMHNNMQRLLSRTDDVTDLLQQAGKQMETVNAIYV